MPEGKISDNLVRSMVSSIVADGASKLTSGSSPELENSVKAADVMLWRNKTISGSVLGSATIIWLLFEWLNYHLLTLVCFAIVMLMLGQFLWVNAAEKFSSSPIKLPRLAIPDHVFVNIAKSLGGEVNRGLGFLQDIACSGNMKQFLLVVGSLWATAVVGSWCNFITVIYIGFVCAHTLPVLYERYDEAIDSFMELLFEKLWTNFRTLDRKLANHRSTGKKGE
ncbi:PREDICTED: reticulon-like protein B8 isoform X2 [Ipomoea nil]|uniref:reticulon-like protein B8 isoform X2 n=1 Tax=Ipomoea nil TaxID=35883 RepID=UPI000901D87B|nr:PREDICTED: reticulon-like protein B8 isoform X2 [Ipomoea nil]